MVEYRVTVLIALYRAGKFVAAKIENLLEQTIFDQVQFVFLNCQNLDGEMEIYKSLLDKPNVLQITYHNHHPLYKTWNDGITHTKSAYLCNSNVDDMWRPTYLERCCSILDERPDIACLTTAIGVTNIPNQTDHKAWNVNQGHLPLLNYPASTAGPCPVWRRNLHDKYGLFDDRVKVIGDAIMWEKWLAGGEKFETIPDRLVLYYASPTSLERQRDPETAHLLRDLDLVSIGRITHDELPAPPTE
jgi:hypothetical protein